MIFAHVPLQNKKSCVQAAQETFTFFSVTVHCPRRGLFTKLL
ncbi:hypothetical protein NBRC111894_3082 [Sporolactobacillus inulinus]|uniref:Uncharacterized protein n=1 Tax=Sporolactobacillus inulinus TaxID=2078 RepID=A0A4Y1ZGC2_9BACL|nr:hypothetical protein NBRC111894_3082 [Sporolactobacillus inulinus]